jgi:hypothetical protein
MSDINNRVKEHWKQETTSRERIRTTLTETTEYASAAGIADRVLTSEPTTRKYLAVSLNAEEEGWADVGCWRTTRKNLAIAKAPLQVGEAHRLVEA